MISALSSPQVSTCIIYPFVYQDIFTELSNKTGSHFYLGFFWHRKGEKCIFHLPKEESVLGRLFGEKRGTTGNCDPTL